MRTNDKASIKLPEFVTEISPRITWSDIIWIEKSIKILKEIASTVEKGKTKGINTLFTGENYTMKTIAAEVLANKLNHKLFKIDLSSLISKYIGETEKNLKKIFDSAENREIILFFDEADALFGKRSEVRDSHDQYTNTVREYLLNRMQSHDGIVILATNQDDQDSAYVRSIKYQIDFPFPDNICRSNHWKQKIQPK